MEKLREGSGDDQSMAFALSQLCLMGHLTLKMKITKPVQVHFAHLSVRGLTKFLVLVLCSVSLSEGFAILEKHRH